VGVGIIRQAGKPRGRSQGAALAVGDEMIPVDALLRGDFAELTRPARAFVEAVQRARGQAERRAQPVRPIEGPDTR